MLAKAAVTTTKQNELPVITEGKKKILHGRSILREFKANKLALQRIVEEIRWSEGKAQRIDSSVSVNQKRTKKAPQNNGKETIHIFQ